MPESKPDGSGPARGGPGPGSSGPGNPGSGGSGTGSPGPGGSGTGLRVPDARKSAAESAIASSRTPGGQPIGEEQLEQVIRRATELQLRGSSLQGDALEASDVIQIGAEVGIPEHYIRQALAELHAVSLVPPVPTSSLDRVTGSAFITASRVVPGDPLEVEANLGAHLEAGELLKQVRARQGESLWEPAAGVVTQMRRAMDFSGRGYLLAKSRQLKVTVAGLESGWSLVTLVLDFGNMRGERLGGWLAGMAAGGVAGSVWLAIAMGGWIAPAVAGLAICSGSVWGGLAIARYNIKQLRQRIGLVLDGLLDRLERGETLCKKAEPWHRKFLRA